MRYWHQRYQYDKDTLQGNQGNMLEELIDAKAVIVKSDVDEVRDDWMGTLFDEIKLARKWSKQKVFLSKRY